VLGDSFESLRYFQGEKAHIKRRSTEHAEADCLRVKKNYRGSRGASRTPIGHKGRAGGEGKVKRKSITLELGTRCQRREMSRCPEG